MRYFTLGDEAYEIFYKHGFHVLWKSDYLPFPDRTEIEKDYWENESDLIGVEMNDESALLLHREVLPAYLEEFRYPENIFDAFPELLVMREEYPQSEHSSFWIRVKPEVLK